MVKRILLVGSALLVAIAFAQTAYRLVINGRAATGSAIVVKGETYVPLKALQAAGVKVTTSGGSLSLTFPAAAGGANQVAAVEGRLNEWLFNGIWRLRVLSVAPSADSSGWDVKVEVRNGTKEDALSISGTGYDGLKLVFGDGKMLETSGAGDISSHSFPQGGAEIFTLNFPDENLASHKPEKLLLLIKPDADLVKYLRDRMKIGYTVPDPSFRVNIGS